MEIENNNIYILNTTKFTDVDYIILPQWLRNNWGSKVEFNNGCIVWLENDLKMIWGTNPYGLDWGCNYSDGWELSIINWVKYWDKKRSETGSLIVNC